MIASSAVADGQVLLTDDAPVASSSTYLVPGIVAVWCFLGTALFVIASTIILSLIPLYVSERNVDIAATCASAPFETIFNINNAALTQGSLSRVNQDALETAINQYLSTQPDYSQCSVRLREATVQNCTNSGRRRRQLLQSRRFLRQTSTNCYRQQLRTTSVLNCNCECRPFCLRQRKNRLESLLLDTTFPLTLTLSDNRFAVTALTGMNLLATGSVITPIIGNQFSQCYRAISGIYLQRYTDSASAALERYVLKFFFPLGGMFQMNSGEKTNPNDYFSDASGYYQCGTLASSNTTPLSYGNIYYGQTNPRRVNVVESNMVCEGALDESSDRVVQCTNGELRSQGYELKLPDLSTGYFTNPIPNTEITRRFESLRLYTHSAISSKDYDACYEDLNGVAVGQYPDGTYDMTSFSGLGYLITVYSAARTSDGIFTQSTTIGTWYCTNERSISGNYNYFTFSNSTESQSIVSGSFYKQCPRTSHDNCTGVISEIGHPLQYQFLPFRDGQPESLSTSSYISNRLFPAPTISSCHEKFGGIYAFQATIESQGETNFVTYTLYRNAIYFSNGVYETNPKRAHTNMLGVWNCDLDGNISADRAYFVYADQQTNTSAYIVVGNQRIKCDSNAERCTGIFYIFNTAGLELPVNDVFPSARLFANGTLLGRRLRVDT